MKLVEYLAIVAGSAKPDVAKRRLHELVECADALGEAAG